MDKWPALPQALHRRNNEGDRRRDIEQPDGEDSHHAESRNRTAKPHNATLRVPCLDSDTRTVTRAKAVSATGISSNGNTRKPLTSMSVDV